MLFVDEVAVVTGASRGIGRAIAEKLASEGAKVVVGFSNNESKALEVVQQIESNGGQAIALKVDVSNSESVAEFFNSIVEKFQKIDILVNNAGITRDSLILRMKDEDFDAVIDTNLKGIFYCTKAAAKVMLKARSGRIVNIASVVGEIGNAGQANYSAAKAGVIALTKTSAKEFASRGINVNAVAPGFIETDMTNVLKDEVKSEMSKSIPLNRFGKPEDVANVVAFLASDSASYITGQTLNVDGGMVM
ncbi:MAG: 3-oxoacyl-[Selenomonadaceae bacterium]|nr:3-oxoacyl-[acyl-carrier-protein] reductase [Selenomonadaceae bacterium]